MKTADLTVFAHKIAQEKLKVPLFIIQAGLRAISARKQYSFWYKENADKSSKIKKNNDKHAHFIALLEEVLVILEPFVEKPTANPQKPTTSVTTSNVTESLVNKFGALDVHEPAEVLENELLGQQSSAGTAKGKKCGSSNICYELEASEDEIKDTEIFATYCLLEDFNMTRHCPQVLERLQERLA